MLVCCRSYISLRRRSLTSCHQLSVCLPLCSFSVSSAFHFCFSPPSVCFPPSSPNPHLSTPTSAPAAAAAVLSAVAFCLLIIFLQSSAVYSFSVPVIEAVFESKRCCSVLLCRPALPALAESLRLLSQIHMRRRFSDRFKMCVV